MVDNGEYSVVLRSNYCSKIVGFFQRELWVLDYWKYFHYFTGISRRNVNQLKARNRQYETQQN